MLGFQKRVEHLVAGLSEWAQALGPPPTGMGSRRSCRQGNAAFSFQGMASSKCPSRSRGPRRFVTQTRSIASGANGKVPQNLQAQETTRWRLRSAFRRSKAASGIHELACVPNREEAASGLSELRMLGSHAKCEPARVPVANALNLNSKAINRPAIQRILRTNAAVRRADHRGDHFLSITSWP